MKALYVFTLSFSIICHGNAQSFTKVTPAAFVGLNYSHNTWFDFDNDGDLDIIANGAEDVNGLRTMIYQNNGNDVFVLFNSQSPLPQYGESEIGFINLDGNAQIDLLMMGRRIGDENTDRISQIKNTTTGFTDLGTIPGFGKAQGYGTISVGDVNNDGTDDVFLSGISGFSEGNPQLTAVMFKREDATYTPLENNLIPVYIAASRLADLDNDEDLDLIVCGSDGVYPYQNTQVYYNNGDGVFTEASMPLTQLQNPSIDVADYDADGDLDILLSGLDETGKSATKVFYDDEGTYNDLPLPESINRTASGSARWADFDNDGDPDILVTGRIGPEGDERKIAIYENDGGLFYEVEDTSFDILGLGQASWGDYDNDGDLDILVSGADTQTPDIGAVLYILKNGSASKNVKPAPPTDFTVTPLTENSVTLSWDRPVDDHTPTNSLTFNLSVKNGEGDFLLHPFSDDVTGKRNITEQGNMWLNLGWHIKDLNSGTWLFKIQAIDAGLAASEWTASKTFYSGSPAAPSNLALTYGSSGITLTWNDDSNNEEFFIVERQVGSGAFEKIGEVTSNVKTYVDNVSAVGTYQYRVFAKNPNDDSGYSNTATFTILGFEDHFLTASMVYPNPVFETMFIVAKDLSNDIVSAAFVDVKGVVQRTARVQLNHEGEASIDVSSLTDGMYVLKIESNRGARVFKVIKE